MVSFNVCFEDNENLPVPRLIKSILGNNCVFTCGNRNLRIMLHDIHYINNVICCMDYVDDNKDIVRLYVDVFYQFRKSVLFIRIPCIEVLAYELVKDLGIKLNYSSHNVDIIEYYMSRLEVCSIYIHGFSSFEKYLKDVTMISPSCINTRGNDKNKRGKFYYTACNCGEEHCQITNRSISVVEKFEIIYNKLPVHFKFENNELYSEFITSRFDWDEFYSREKIVAVSNMINKNRAKT